MKPERMTAIFFLMVIMLFASVACLASVGFGIKIVDNWTKILTPPPEIIDWEKLYPFDDNKTHKTKKSSSLLKRVKDVIGGRDSITGYYNVVEAARKYKEIIGWNMTSIFDYDPVIRLEDGYLATLIESRDISKNAEALRDFDVFCRENGTELIYINFPTKICKFQDQNVAGQFDYANQNADRLLSMLRKYGVKCYDFREFLHDDGMDHHASFFVTDHHWKPETGLWAAERILRLLRDDYGWPVEPEILNPENFDYVVYHDWFLGSQGKKFTLARTKPEDISLIYPKFQTFINFQALQHGINVNGDFSVTYNMTKVETRDYYKKNPYATYKYADEHLSRFNNFMNSNGKRILIIHDSFSRCVIPFVALGIQYTDDIDPRHFTGSIESFIISEKPDVVIVCCFSSMIAESTGSDKNFYDFR